MGTEPTPLTEIQRKHINGFRIPKEKKANTDWRRNRFYNKKKYYCPYYENNIPDDWFMGRKDKSICELCGGFLGEKLHVNYQKEREQEEK